MAKICLDCDDVLLDCNSSLALFHNDRYGTSYGRNDVLSWHMEKLWGCTKEEAVRRVSEWYKSREHDEMAALSGAIEAVTQLSVKHELHVVTARPIRESGITQAILNKHFPRMFTGVHFTNHFEDNLELRRSKGDVCREIGSSLFVEDSDLHARDVAGAGIPVLLMDSPWNQEEVLEANIIRIFTWQDVLDFVR